MKDKLIKTNHKKSYYLIRKFGVLTIGLSTSLAIVTIPTYILINNEIQRVAEAKQKQLNDNDEAEKNSEQQMLHY